MTTIVAYARVSTTEQTTDNQLAEIARAGFTVDPDFTFVEQISGGVQAMQRPVFAEMFGKLRKGDTLVVTKLDRLGRDALDVQATVKALAAKAVHVQVLQLGHLDLTSAAGKLMVTMLSAVAEMERDLLRERTAAGLVRAKAEGKKLGRPECIGQDQREEAARRVLNGEMSQRQAAEQYGVGKGTIARAVEAMKAAATA